MVTTVHAGQLTTDIPPHLSNMTLRIGQDNFSKNDDDDTDTEEQEYKKNKTPDNNDKGQSTDQNSKEIATDATNSRKELTRQRTAEVERWRIARFIALDTLNKSGDPFE